MKTIRVVAAVIADDKNRIYATQRGYGDFKGGWEFPGGKIEQGETPSEAIKREIKEELGTEIEVCDTLGTVEFDYPKFHLSMDCFICHVTSGHLTLLEHMAAKWLDKDTIDSVAWLSADVMVVQWVKKYMAWL